MVAGCGTGKSTRVREFLEDVWKERPHARVLLVSANILYGTNLASESRREFPGRVLGFYKDTVVSDDGTRGEQLAKCDIVVCSMESLHLVINQTFEVCFIDETRHISGLVGGATMNNFNNLRLLRHIVKETPRVICADADLLLKVDDTEPAPKGVDFINCIAQGRPVTCASMTGPRPTHLARQWRPFFSHKKAAVGAGDWWRELSAACDAWHANHKHRIAICVGNSKGQLKQVSEFFEKRGVPWKVYCGISDQESKRRLADPDGEWEPLGAIVFTTTLSIGVDPKWVQFARLFMWTYHNGCDLVAMFQAMFRFGRSKDAPLLNPVIDVLLGCKPPELQAALLAEGKGAPLRKPTYNEQYDKLTRQHGERMQCHAQMVCDGGGWVGDVRVPSGVTGTVLGVMAHSELEKELKQCQHFELFTRLCAHHGWERVEYAGGVGAAVAGDEDVQPLNTDPDDKFVGLMSEPERYVEVLRYVLRHDQSAFLEQCYGFASREASGESKSSRRQFLIDLYWLLRPFGSLECLDLEPRSCSVYDLIGLAPDADADAVKATCKMWTVASLQLTDGQRTQGLLADGEPVLDPDKVKLVVQQVERACADVRSKMRGEVSGDVDAVTYDIMDDDVEQEVRLLRAAFTLVDLARVRKGLELNAHSRCLGLDVQCVRDRNAHLRNPREPHPMLTTSLSTRMRTVKECAKLLEVESLTDPCVLPERIVKMANAMKKAKRKRKRDADEADGSSNGADREGDGVEEGELGVEDVSKFVGKLRLESDALVGSKGGDLVELLKQIATASGMRLVVEEGRPGGRGESRDRVIYRVQFVRNLPHMVDSWLVWSDQLDERVPVGQWDARHAEIVEEEQWAAMQRDAELDGVEGISSGDTPDAPAVALSCAPHAPTDSEGLVRSLRAMIDPATQRLEKLDGVALSEELDRLRSKGKGKFTSTEDEDENQDKKWLTWLEAADARALPRAQPLQPPPPIRFLLVTYHKSRGFGRRMASWPSLQSCPSGLRPRLVKRWCHDADIRNCYPVFFVQVLEKVALEKVEQLGLFDEEALEALRRYVSSRDEMLASVGEFYGVSPSKCKFAFLRVLHGGSIMAWVHDKDTGCTRNKGKEAPDLKAVANAANVVRRAVFRIPWLVPHVETLSKVLFEERKAALGNAERRLAMARTPEAQEVSKKEVANARRKYTAAAIKRTVFSLCVGEIEDRVLSAIDTSLQDQGWAVPALIFDGLMVEHRDDADFEAAMRRAEEAVRERTGYRIELVEKPLYVGEAEVCGEAGGKGGGDAEDGEDDENVWLIGNGEDE